MTAPRRLWSGDWQLESAAHAEELANRRAETGEHAGARPALDAAPSTRSMPARAVAWLQTARRRLARSNAGERRLIRWNARARHAAPFVLTMLLAGGATYALVSVLIGSSGQSPANSSEAPGWLGVELVSFPFGGGSFPLGGGALIGAVAPGSPAGAAGLEPGDVITQIDNRRVVTPSDVDAALAGTHAGEHVQIEYDRVLSTYSTEATLAAQPHRSP
jgi:PDZ domain